jgi:hypothetical protein
MQPFKIKDKTFYIHFGSYAVQQFCEAAGWKLSEAMQKLGTITQDDIETIVLLIFHGFKDGARKAGKEFDLTIPDVYDLIDDDPELINNVLTNFVGSVTPADNPAKKKKAIKALK